jgi:hypothetical protein
MAAEVGGEAMVMPATREAQAIPAHLIIILTIARDRLPQVREAVRARRPVPIRLQAPDRLVQVLRASVLPPQIQLRRPLHHIQIVELHVQNRKFLFKIISGQAFWPARSFFFAEYPVLHGESGYVYDTMACSKP